METAAYSKGDYMGKKYGWGIVAGAVIFLIILREAGVFELGCSHATFISMGSQYMTDSPRRLNASSVTYEPEAAPQPRYLNFLLGTEKQKPLSNKEQRELGYAVTVRYRIVSDFTWGRWIPLYKTGRNVVQVRYEILSHAGTPFGCGYTEVEAKKTVIGFSSARKYKDDLIQPLLKEMQEAVGKKIVALDSSCPVKFVGMQPTP